MTVRTACVFAATPDPTELVKAAALLGAEGPGLAHAFEPQGHSLAVLGVARRVVIHTWPEHGLLTVDVYAASAVDLLPLQTTLGWIRLAEALPGDEVERRTHEEHDR